MVVGVTDDHLLVWRASFGLGRPVQLAGSLPIDEIAGVAAARHGIVTGVAFALNLGGVVEIEALRGRRLRAFARELHAVVTEHPRRP
ncbi:MAG: hypothetical protein ACT4OX_01050 [Actinomycetota bacterium]